MTPTAKLARLRAEIAEMARKRELLRSHGVCTVALDRQLAAKTRTLALLEGVAAELERVTGARAAGATRWQHAGENSARNTEP
ncbi:MAG: hypothetical protein ACREM1_12975 [Longimicrobiales bacterium]